MRAEALLLATTLYLASSKQLTGMEGGTYHCPAGAVLDHKMCEVEESSGGSPGQEFSSSYLSSGTSFNTCI